MVSEFAILALKWSKSPRKHFFFSLIFLLQKPNFSMHFTPIYKGCRKKLVIKKIFLGEKVRKDIGLRICNFASTMVKNRRDEIYFFNFYNCIKECLMKPNKFRCLETLYYTVFSMNQGIFLLLVLISASVNRVSVFSLLKRTPQR